jgi:hypothetical protein
MADEPSELGGLGFPVWATPQLPLYDNLITFFLFKCREEQGTQNQIGENGF